MDLRLPCTTVREGTLTEPGLPWDVLPGGAARCLQWVPHEEMGFVAGASPRYRTQLPLGCPFPTRPRWALHGRRSYTSNGLWMSLPREGIQDSRSLRLLGLFSFWNSGVFFLLLPVTIFQKCTHTPEL